MDSSVTKWSAVSSAWLLERPDYPLELFQPTVPCTVNLRLMFKLRGSCPYIFADLASVRSMPEYWKSANSQGHNFRYINFHVSNLTPTLIFITLPWMCGCVEISLQNRSTTADCWFVFIRYWWPLIIQRNSPDGHPVTRTGMWTFGAKADEEINCEFKLN